MIKNLKGKTIQSVEVIKAEYGKIYREYACIVTTDGDKFLIGGNTPYDPKPPIDEMKKAPNFFSPDDIAESVRREEIENRQRRENREEQERAELDRLKKKYE